METLEQNEIPKWNSLSEDQKLREGLSIKKRVEGAKRKKYADLSNLEKFKWAQALNIQKLRDGQKYPIQSQYDTLEKSIALEEERQEKIAKGEIHEDEETQKIIDNTKIQVENAAFDYRFKEVK